MVFTLDTDSFLNAFYRWLVDGGYQESSFQTMEAILLALKKKMRELVEKLNKEIMKSTANQGIKCKYILQQNLILVGSRSQ